MRPRCCARLDSPPDVQSGLRVADKHVRGHAAHVSEGLQASPLGAPPFHPVRVAAHPDQPWGLGCGQKLGALSTRLSKRSLSQTLMRDLDELQSSFKERYSRLLEKRLRTGARLVHTWLCSSISHMLVGSRARSCTAGAERARWCSQAADARWRRRRWRSRGRTSRDAAICRADSGAAH